MCRPCPPFEIRVAQIEDASAVSKLLAASYGQFLRAAYHPKVLAAALPILSSARPELLASRSYFVAQTGGGEIIAAGGWSWQGPVGGATPLDMGHIRHVAVAPAFVGCGIGRVLLGHVREDALCERVRVLSCISTINAQHFFQRAGMTRRCEVALTLAPGISFPAIDMRLNLAGASA